MDIPTKFAGYSKEYHNETFSSYRSLKFHEKLIQDKFMKCMRDVIVKNKQLFQDKIVLDVDCGIGILSIFIASQGARKVIGIESSHLAKCAERAVEANRLGHIVQIIQQKVVEIDSLPQQIEKVDIIVSQWMGFLLFDKELLDSLIQARIRWLKSNGLMFPDTISLHITTAEYESRKIAVYNMLKYEEFDLTSLKNFEFSLPKIEIVPKQKIVTNSAVLKMMNLKKFFTQNFSIDTEFVLTARRQDNVNAFVLFFEVGFSKCHKKMYISSSPFEFPSLWKHIVLCFENRLVVNKNEQIFGNFIMKPGQNNSTLIFKVDISCSGHFCKTRFYNKYVF